MAEDEKKPAPIVEIKLIGGGTQKLEARDTGPVINNSAVAVLRATLKEVEDGDIHHLLIVGRKPDGEIVLRWSNPVDQVMYLGLLECAKMAMLNTLGRGRPISRKLGPDEEPLG